MMTIDRFAIAVRQLDEPAAVLDAMHAAVRLMQMNAYATWRIPVYRTAPDSFVVGQNVWQHSSVPPAFWLEFWPQAQRRGSSPLAQLAMSQCTLITLTEGMRKLKLTGGERWNFDLWRKHGMRDGAYCPIGRWMTCFWSGKVLKLTPAMRADLFRLAAYGAFQMDAIAVRRGIDGKAPALTAREIAALRLASRGHRAAEIAADLGITVDTVREHLKQATKKLGAKSPAHAACQALRLHLIS